MYKKVTVIVILALILGLLLYFKPFKKTKEAELNVENVLPEADLVGRVNLLEFLKETSDLLNFNEVPLRGFLTYEFMLSIAKSYGIDLQDRSYVFANDRGDYGCIIHLSNSSKLQDAIERISIDFELSVTKRGSDKIYQIKNENISFFYRKNFLLIYSGAHFDQIYRQVLDSKPGRIRSSWKQLFSETHFKNDHVVLYSQSNIIKEYGVHSVLMSHDSDSSGLYLKSLVQLDDSIPLLINTLGTSMNFSESSKRKIDVHVNFPQMNTQSKRQIERKLEALTKKISFPVADFLELWAGDLCFEEGGFYKVTEEYVETELDENFETQEVLKTREVIVPRYKLMFTTVKPARTFISKLLNKGLLTKEDERVRFLFSPLLSYSIKKDGVIFYSSKYIPSLEPSTENVIHWDYKGTDLEFSIDSTANNTIYGGLNIPLEKLIKNADFP